MFENYGTYAKEVLSAAKGSRKMRLLTRLFIGGIASLAIVGCISLGGITHFTDAQMALAMESVAKEIPTCSIEIQLDPQQEGTSSEEEPFESPVIDEELLTDHIKSALTQNVLSRAEGRYVGDGLLDIEMVTDDGVAVTVSARKGDNGEYAIERVVAVVDKDAACGQDAIGEEEWAKAEYSLDFGQLDASTLSDIDTERRTAPLTDNVTLVLPEGWTERDIDADEESGSIGKYGTKAKNTSISVKKKSVKSAGTSKNAGSADADVSESSNSGANEYGLAEFAGVSKEFENKETGAQVTVRQEKLEDAIATLGGHAIAKKMSAYWKETTLSLADASTEEIVGGEDGVFTRVFYNGASGIWGYLGRVITRNGDVESTSERTVIVDEAQQVMLTISYRVDADIVEEVKGSAAGEKKIDSVSAFADVAAPVQDMQDVASSSRGINGKELFLFGALFCAPSNTVGGESPSSVKMQ